MNAGIEQTLSQVEASFDSVSDAIRSGEPDALVIATSGLKQAAVDFSRLINQIDLKSIQGGAFELRVKSLAAGFAIQRENLIRRSVAVDQALNIVVPAARVSTYQSSSLPSASYGGGGRASGEFALIKA